MNLRKIAGVALTTALLFSVAGCSNTKKVGGNAKGEQSNASMTIWAEDSLSKIKRDDEGEAVKNASDKGTLKIEMCRNESEGGQVMIYAKKDISSYQISVTDLVSDTGIISAEDIKIYHMKYLTCDTNLEGNPEFATGEIPDQMLPFEAAKEYKENAVKEGNNQAVFLDITTTTSTPAGTYYGTAVVKSGLDSCTLPIEVTVCDVTLPDTAALKTSFSWWDRDVFATAELDGSDEKATAYFETLLDYNMSSFFPFEGVGGADAYVELVRKYYDYPGFSAYRLFFQPGTTAYNGQVALYNAKLLKQYIMKIANASVEDHVNYLDKAYCYFYTVADEPRNDAQFKIAKDSLDFYENLIQEADMELREQYVGTSDYTYYNSVVSEAVQNIPTVLPGANDLDKIKEFGIENYTHVSTWSTLSRESDRELYRDMSGGKNWAYSCNFPRYPYPSFHIDDSVVGTRMMAWMCYDYDFEGYLYWAVANSVWGVNAAPLEDSWETSESGLQSPGDAKFFYPGAKYGLDAPCPSLRAVAWRDGVDDYSLLQIVEETYTDYGIDVSVKMSEQFGKLYTGTVPIGDATQLFSSRHFMFDLLATLTSGQNVTYVGTNIDYTTGTVRLQSLNDAAVVVVDGKEATPDESGLYTFEVDLTKQTEFEYTVKCDGKSEKNVVTIFENKFGVVNGFEASDTTDHVIFSSTAGYKAETNTNETYVKNGTQSLHITMNQDKENTVPYFAIEKDSPLIGGKWSNMKYFSFYVYNASDEDCDVDITYYTTGEKKVTAVTLKAGEWTPVTVLIPAELDNPDSIKEFDFNFAEGCAVDVYIDNFTTVEKGE